MRTIMFILTALLIGLGSFGATASAHSTGASWEVPAGSYTADVGYDTPTFTAGNSSRFDFNLKEAPGTTSVAVPFAEVWVRVKDANTTLLATGIRKQPIGPTTLLYDFRLPGAYVLEASFRDKDGAEIGAASFPLTVASGEGGSEAVVSLFYLAAGGVLGVVLAILFSTVKKLRKS